MKYQTAEAVFKGHPDKLCDLIADLITDFAIYTDPNARCAIEVFATGHKIFVCGELSHPKTLPIRQLVRHGLDFAGYDPRFFSIDVLIRPQSKNIDHGVSNSVEVRSGQATDEKDAIGAGDQGTVYGYATDETPERLPYAYVAATRLARAINEAILDGELNGYGPDGKCQVSLSNDGDVYKLSSVVISVSHRKSKPLESVRRELADFSRSVLAALGLFMEDAALSINPAGAFHIFGPYADTGLTGRKLMVDSYGGLALHGGGAFSGKDPSKVDRSGAYMARFIAKTIVDAKLAKRCQVAISYSIGGAHPVAFDLDCFGTEAVALDKLKTATLAVFDLRPRAIIEELKLTSDPIYSKTSSFGHFTSEDFPWEQTKKKAEALNAEVYAHA